MSQDVIALTQHNFIDTVTQHSLVLVDFWAQWCGPCRAFAEIYHAAALKHKEVLFTQVNIEEEPELAQEFGIRSIPFLMVFRGDVIVYAQAGALTAPALEDIIAKASTLDPNTIQQSIQSLDS